MISNLRNHAQYAETFMLSIYNVCFLCISTVVIWVMFPSSP